MKAPGAKRERLAKMLNSAYPEHCGLSLSWEAEKIYPATGAYRTNRMLDCTRWEAFAHHYRPDGSSFPVITVYGYYTITELVKASALKISPDGEVLPVRANREG